MLTPLLVDEVADVAVLLKDDVRRRSGDFRLFLSPLGLTRLCQELYLHLPHVFKSAIS